MARDCCKLDQESFINITSVLFILLFYFFINLADTKINN